jgi:hypothetical protein
MRAPLLLLLVLSCAPAPAESSTGRGDAAGSRDPAADDTTALLPPPAPEASGPADVADHPAPEARRAAAGDLAREPLLAPHLATGREHFGRTTELALEALPLSEARTVALVSAGDRHLILAVDQRAGEASTIAWSKDRPLAGTFPGATELALAGGPEGQVHLAWFDPTTRSVALRRWRFDGTVEADWMLGRIDGCDAVSARYWPTQGWLVVASNLGTARAFLLDVGGTLRWKGGVAVDLERAARAPLTLVPDGDASVILVGVGTARTGGRRAPEHVLAARLDPAGHALWDQPVDLGRAPPDAVRIGARVAGPGLVAVALGPHREALLASSGAVKPR